ncbi:dynein regulatory complex protein 10 [Chanos chanos]|uniref:Dynein regulatory complex protein 10 n=1 Tax=Chanos chanos TaxID=29144 RepID=A0A6J2WV96_CHACN|nr:dynein regulatory complex protein 10 [Chanos chanos]
MSSEKTVDASAPKARGVHQPSTAIITPSRRKLVSLETQRIAGVLDECIQKVEVVSMLSGAQADPGHLSESLGQGLIQALLEYQHQGQSLQAVSQDMTMHAQAAKTVRSSLLNVLRHVRVCPAAGKALRGIGQNSVEGAGSRRLVAELQELRSVLLERLLTTPGEEREQARLLQETTLRHQSNLEQVATLEQEVSAAMKDRDEEISKKNDVIISLKKSLYHQEKSCEDFRENMTQNAKKQIQSDQKTSETKQSRMQQEASQLRVQLNNLITENREVEMALRKRKYKVETEIENWIQKYDADMGEKQAELEDLTQVYEEEKAELQELQEHYAVLELEYSQIMEERRIAQERKEEEEREREVKSRAATLIQAYWRGFRVRTSTRGKAKSKKGKKGKGKKNK